MRATSPPSDTAVKAPPGSGGLRSSISICRQRRVRPAVPGERGVSWTMCLEPDISWDVQARSELQQVMSESFRNSERIATPEHKLDQASKRLARDIDNIKSRFRSERDLLESRSFAPSRPEHAMVAPESKR